MAIDLTTDTDQLTTYLNQLATGGKPESHPNFGIYQSMVERIEKDALQGDITGVLTKIEGLKKTGQFPKLGAGAAEKKKQDQRPTKGNMPSLPDELQFSQALIQSGCKWLDDAWMPWSRIWSPNGYEHFHEMTGIFLLSTIASGRVMMNEGGLHSTNLYCLLAGKPARYAKSMTASLVEVAMSAMDIKWMLYEGEATPQAFISDMLKKVAVNYNEMDAHEQHQEEMRLTFAGQKAWSYDEFGNKISSIAKEGGFMSAFHGMFLTFDNVLPEYTYRTKDRGKETIERPYLSILGSLTPKNVRVHAATDAPMWGDGFLSRFLIECPPSSLPGTDDDPPRIARSVPQEITSPLLHWHDSLGAHPTRAINEGTDANPKYALQPQTQQILYCTWTDEAYAAYRSYKKALSHISFEMHMDDFDGSYDRLPMRGIRVAMLFASLDNGGVIELRHWARAQVFIEHCREGLHNFYNQVNLKHESADKQREDKILELIKKKGRITQTELCQLAHERAGTVSSHLKELEHAGFIQSESLIAPNGRKVTWYSPID